MPIACGQSRQAGLRVLPIRRALYRVVVRGVGALKREIRRSECIGLLAERAGRERCGAASRLRRGDDVDHAADRSGAVERGAAAFDDFDSIDPADRKLFEIDVVDLSAGDWKTVEEHENLLRRAAANADGRLRAERAVTNDVHSGHVFDGVGDCAIPVTRDLRRGHDVRRASRASRHFAAAVAGHDVCDLGNGRRRG